MRVLRDETWPLRSPVLLQIGLATFGILSLELALIRWMSGQVRILAYFNNLILIGCFLGMGVGLLLARRFPGLVHLTLPALAVVALPLAFSERLGIVYVPFPDPAVHLWGAEATPDTVARVLHAYLLVMGLFAAVVVVFAAAGAAAGHLLHRSGGLRGYSADLVGSLLGVLATALVTAMGLTPPFWFLVGALPFLCLSRRVVSALSFVALLALAQGSVKGAIFSPYNRIDLRQTALGFTVFVNRDFHQDMHDLSAPTSDLQRGLRRMYDLPFVLGDARSRALVVGAGTGNDVQAALRQGFGQVYSVDIDGRIIELGQRLHPEHPYAQPRAVPVVNDARAFFEQYRGQPFDTVCYGLVDSHAAFSALSTLRLDNYLYTEEGLRSGWRHVAPGGHMTVTLSFIGGPWLLGRLHWTLAQATGVRPLVVTHDLYSAVTFVVARDPAALHWERVEGARPERLVEPRREDVLLTSDDWPFLYLRPGTVPWGYVLVLASVVALATLLVRWSQDVPGGSGRFDWTLFLMGAGFLLVETRGVTSLSLLFGSTWVVNAAVFSGVLLMALAANLLVERRPPSSTLPAFAFLLVSLALLWAVDIGALNRLGLLPRALAGGALTGLPVACAGVVVSTLLARARDLPASLGANLLGSVCGGCLEYLSMYAGLRALVLLAFALYLGALLLERRRQAAEGVLSVPS